MNSVWIKSSLSLSNGNCVEVTELRSGGVGVRNSKYTGEPVLQFTSDEWHAFLGGARNGEFDSFGGTASSVGAGLARDVAFLRDGLRDQSIPPLTCHLVHEPVSPMQRACCPRRASNRRAVVTCPAWTARHPTSRQFSTTVEKYSPGDEADKSSHPRKNRQMFSPHHVESGDA